MTAPGRITCVEWSEPVSARWAMGLAWNHRDLSPLTAVYLIEDDGAPIYVGCTTYPVTARLYGHRGCRTPLGFLLRRVWAGEFDLTVRWTAGDRALEAQAIRALKPRLNSINPNQRNVPALPVREAA